MAGPLAVTLGILAGGQATRLGGVDKALQQLQGTSLIERTLAALAACADGALCSYNGQPGAMSRLGLCAVRDLRPGRPGPLAGLEALLEACPTPWLLVVPVDLRTIPGSLDERMLQRAQAAGGVRGVVANDLEGRQPLVSLWPVADAIHEVRLALDEGRASVRDLQQRMQFVECDLSPLQLGNLNSPGDFG